MMNSLESIEDIEKNEEEEKESNGEDTTFHVLVVDDSIIDRKLLEKLLTLSSYQVTCVESGDKALEYLGLLTNHNINLEISDCTSLSSAKQKLQGSKVNLIMTDYSMPGMSGYDLLKIIKGSSWKDVPVVVMSSENVPSRINMCLEGGAKEFLLKPLKLSDLKMLQSQLLVSSTGNSHSHEDEDEDEDEDEYEDEDEDEDENEDDDEINCSENIKDESNININTNKRKKATSQELSELRIFVAFFSLLCVSVFFFHLHAFICM